MWVKNKKQKQNDIDIFNNCLGYNKYSRSFVMTVYPEQTWVGWLDDLFNIGNINISIKIEPTSNGNVINQLTKKLVQHQSEYATYSRQR